MLKLVFLALSLLHVSLCKAQKGEVPVAHELLPDPEKIEKVDSLNLTPYYPMYGIYGNPTTKVQVSFKYQIVGKIPIYVTYTQIMFWRIGAESTPFKDISFNPELMYRYTFKDRKVLSSLDFIPYGHKSNGRDSVASRSTNYSAVQINWRKDFENWPLKASLRLRSFFFLDKTNDDFRKFEGPIELQTSISRYGNGFFKKIEFGARIYPGGTWGTRWDLGGEEVSAAFRLWQMDIVPAFYLQYFRGYAESLLSYNEKQNQFRVGFLL